MGTTSHSYGERLQSSGSQQMMADAVGRYIDLETEINQFIDQMIDTKKDVINVIQKLNVTEYDVLHKHYVQYISLEDVAEAYGKTYSWATTVQGRALRNVQKILDERERVREKTWEETKRLIMGR